MRNDVWRRGAGRQSTTGGKRKNERQMWLARISRFRRRCSSRRAALIARAMPCYLCQQPFGTGEVDSGAALRTNVLVVVQTQSSDKRLPKTASRVSQTLLAKTVQRHFRCTVDDGAHFGMWWRKL